MKLACLFDVNFYADAIINPEDIINKIVPNVWSFLMQLLAFLVLVFIVIKFAYKPVNKYLTKRQEYIANELKSAQEKEQAATINLQTSKQELNKVRSEANEIIEKAKQDALKTKDEIINSANEEIAMKHKQLAEEIALEKKQAQDEIRNDIIDVALLASEKVLKRDINDADHQKFVDDFIENLD